MGVKTQTCINEKHMQEVILDLVNDFCGHIHPSPPTLTVAAKSIDRNGKWFLDSLVTYQAASYAATMFSLPKDLEPFVLFENTSLEAWARILCNHIETENPDIVFYTSGTSGKRKAISHSLLTLILEAQEWISLLGEIEHIYINVPRHHIYGFIWGVLIPSIVKCKVTDFRTSLINKDKLSKSTLIVSTPHAAALLMVNSEAEKADTTVILSTSPCEHSLLVNIKNQGYKDVYHIYGSTETGGIGYRTQDCQHFSLCESISKKSESLYRVGKVLPIQDKLCFLDNMRFTIFSRLDHAIQIRGYNVNVKILEGLIGQNQLIKDLGIRVSGLEQEQYLEVLIETNNIDQIETIKEDISLLYSHIINKNNVLISNTSIRNIMGKLITDSNSHSYLN